MWASRGLVGSGLARWRVGLRPVTASAKGAAVAAAPPPSIGETAAATQPLPRPLSAWDAGTPLGPQQQQQQQPAEAADTWRPIPPMTWWRLPGIALELSKARLASLVVLTTMGGYALAPGMTDLPTLLWTSVGTGLCIASANSVSTAPSINQWIEAPYDAQMSRTRTRPLPRRAASPFTAFAVGIGSGVAGVTALATLVNPLTAALGLGNIVLYTLVYTPMKRTSIANTWVGAIVGGIPPIMGWTAAVNGLDSSAAVLGYILFAWQFPHFNALAWNLRADYSKAGYRMASVSAPDLNARVALRYAISMVPATLLAPVVGLTTPWFIVGASVANTVLVHRAWRFYKHSNDQSARNLFFTSLMYLPAILVLMMLHKKQRAVHDAHDDDTLDDGHGDTDGARTTTATTQSTTA